MHVGIVLAGGEACRMPNKLLLPTYHRLDQRIVVESAIRLCLEAGCKQIHVAARRPDEALVLIFKSLLPVYCDLKFFYESGGVGNAVKGCLDGLYSGTRCLVTFGDNIYADVEEPRYAREALDDTGPYPQVSVRRHAPSVAMQMGLDWWNETKQCWMRADKQTEADYAGHTGYPFAGWVAASRDKLYNWAGKDTVSWLNDSQAKARMVLSENWYDVGSLAGYETYLRRYAR